MDSDPLSPRWDSGRLSSSSFPRQGWPRLCPSHAPPLGVAGPSHPNWPYESATEDFDRLHHTTSLHPRRDSQFRREPAGSTVEQSTPIVSSTAAAPGPSSTANTQPVLVRAYSGNADSTTAKSSTMSSTRRLFPFKGSKGSTPSRPPGPPLPSDKEFSIENILQAIEPDIQGTLDSIAEICGRSKLSLANEYGSHIAPLGEIRAPAGGLVPVEEATSTDERRADEGVVIFDDDPNLMDAGRDVHPLSFYRYLENIQQASLTLERNGAAEARPNTHLPNARNDPDSLISDMENTFRPSTREFVTTPKNSGRNLLAKQVNTQQDPSQDIVTPAVISEVHLDAQFQKRTPAFANETRVGISHVSDAVTENWQAPELIHSLIGWLKWTARVAGPESQPTLQSAEDRLRSMLERNSIDAP